MTTVAMLPPARLQAVPVDVMSLSERQFIFRAAAETGIRQDGRRCAEARPLFLHLSTINSARSLAKVSLSERGGTKVMCIVSCELGAPYPDRPNEGGFQITTDYMHSAGTGQNTSILELGLVEKALQKAVDVESLCIVPAVRAWFVKCQLVVVDDFGAVGDACSVAACAALLHFRRPDVTVVGEDVTVHSVREKIPVPLTVQYLPLSISFAVLVRDGDNQHTRIVDPTDREEMVVTSSSQASGGGGGGGLVHVLLNAHQEVCGLHEGGALLTTSEVMELVEEAMLVRTARGKVLESALAKYAFEIL